MVLDYILRRYSRLALLYTILRSISLLTDVITKIDLIDISPRTISVQRVNNRNKHLSIDILKIEVN